MSLEHIIQPPEPVDVEHVEAELVAFLGGEQPPEHLRMRGPFVIRSIDQADWCMQRVAEMAAAVREYDDVILLWQEARKRSEAARAWFDARLSEWAVANRTKTRKSFALAHGTVGTREQPAKVVLEDEDAALPWVKAHAPDAVKTVESVLVSKLGDAVQLTTVVSGYDALHKTTGEAQHIDVDPPVPFDPKVLAELRARMDEWTVEPRTHLEARDAHGHPVPGFGVRHSTTSATVRPLGL